MKVALVIFTLLFSTLLFGRTKESFATIEKKYKAAKAPDLGSHLEVALPGRCFDGNDEKPTTMLISLSSDGFEIAPLVVLGRPANYFDNMGWHEVFERHPKVATLFLKVDSRDHEDVIFKREDKIEYRAEVRENEKYLLLKAFINSKVFRYCFYRKF